MYVCMRVSVLYMCVLYVCISVCVYVCVYKCMCICTCVLYVCISVCVLINYPGHESIHTTAQGRASGGHPAGVGGSAGGVPLLAHPIRSLDVSGLPTLNQSETKNTKIESYSVYQYSSVLYHYKL